MKPDDTGRNDSSHGGLRNGGAVYSQLADIPKETARLAYFVQRFDLTRGILDSLARRGVVGKIKFGIGNSCPVVWSISDVINYIKSNSRARPRRSRHGKR